MSFEINNTFGNQMSRGILTNKQKLIVREYKKTLEIIRNRLSKAYAKYATEGSLSKEVMSKYGRLEKIEEQIVDEMNRILKKTSRHVNSSIKGTFKTAYYADNYIISEKSTANFNMALLDEKQLESTIENPYTRIQWPTRLKDSIENTTKQLRSEIFQGISQGYSYQKMSKNVADKLGTGAYKSYRIVRTETHRAQEMGHRKTRQNLSKKLQDKQSQVYKTWDATFDLQTRPKHRQLDGQKVKQKKNFEVSGFSAPAPGMFGVPSMDINCRCTVRTIVENSNFDFKEPERTYKEWYQSRVGKEPKYTKQVPGTVKKSINTNDLQE